MDNCTKITSEVVKRAANRLAKIPASAQRAEEQISRGSVAGCMKSVADVLADIARTVDSLRGADKEKFDELSKHVDRAYSAANKMHRSLPTKVDFS